MSDICNFIRSQARIPHDRPIITMAASLNDIFPSAMQLYILFNSALVRVGIILFILGACIPAMTLCKSIQFL